MSRWRTASFLAALSCASALAVAQSAPTSRPSQSATAPARPKAMDDKFKVVLQRSIFSKDRSKSRSAARPTTAPASPRQLTVFTGVLLTEDDECVAFMENRQDATGRLVHMGDSLAGGVVSEITLDSLSYVSEGKTTQVKIGQNLVGESVGPSAAGAVAAAESTGTSGGGGGDSIAERLRQKRLEEQKKLGQ